MFNTTNNNNNNQTFKVAMCGSRKYPYPLPRPQQKIIGNSKGEGGGGVKGGNFQGVGGFMGNYFSKRVTNQIQNIERNVQSIWSTKTVILSNVVYIVLKQKLVETKDSSR